ncbi:hypothetical protein [Actinomyces viscosus]|uniref:hypothetical protein n=1 Tax=Actinomyces viscosus TaxID=1656 RepID=UPI0018D53444|nr:hypothetical protein [Actinomyces viscosus]
MHSDLIAAVVALVLGALTLANWWFVMFSDHWYADLLRAQSKTWFNLGRNTESLISPASGMFFMFGGLGMLMYPGRIDDSPVAMLLFGGSGVFLAVAVLGLIPFRLPGPMYPEWQMERRRRALEAERARWDAERRDSPPVGRHAASPGSESGLYERYGDGSHDGGSTAPGDELPTRARSTRTDEDGHCPTDTSGVGGAAG